MSELARPLLLGATRARTGNELGTLSLHLPLTWETAAYGALMLLPLALRSHLGRLGALLTSALIAFSPAVLYYSRFAREDIYAAVFSLGIVICIWRYVEEQKPCYLYISAALLALSFATKETTFVFAAITLIFLDLWLAFEFANKSQARDGMARSISFLMYAPFAWLMAALWPLIG